MKKHYILLIASIFILSGCKSPWSNVKVFEISDSYYSSDADLRCKKIQVTGSKLPKRICATKSYWDSVERDAEKTLVDHQQITRDGQVTSPTLPSGNGSND